MILNKKGGDIMFQFNDQQLDAIKKLVKWYFVDSYNQQVFSVAGYA